MQISYSTSTLLFGCRQLRESYSDCKDTTKKWHNQIFMKIVEKNLHNKGVSTNWHTFVVFKHIRLFYILALYSEGSISMKNEDLTVFHYLNWACGIYANILNTFT